VNRGKEGLKRERERRDGDFMERLSGETTLWPGYVTARNLTLMRIHMSGFHGDRDTVCERIDAILLFAAVIFGHICQTD
jgi:hypothetical protein